MRDTATSTYAREWLASRRRRDAAFPDIAFNDHIWAILVDLYVAVEDGASLSLSDIYSAVPAPKATVLRSISRLVMAGILVKDPDSRDGRRTFVRLPVDVHRRLHAALADEQSRLRSRLC